MIAFAIIKKIFRYNKYRNTNCNTSLINSIFFIIISSIIIVNNNNINSNININSNSISKHDNIK